ncbi:MAG: hypothetical protein HQL95_05570 [Magnetococcales bacterium]|nr:hypothetical protein [Magnetococcales bacterium]
MNAPRLLTAPPFRGAVFFLLLSLTAILYQPGISGTFLLDDPPNLRGLNALQTEPGFDQFLYFIGSSPSSQISRPVAMASFAPQYHAWPRFPGEFKKINIALHLVTGALLIWMLVRLTRLMNLAPLAGETVALLAGGIWLIHPLNLSTTLYVVQRMTQLTMIFTLLAMLAYLKGRQHLIPDTPRFNPAKGYLWAGAGIALGGILATLSKENGILLPLFLLVMEATLLATLPRPASWRWFARVFLLAPLAMLALYLLSHWETYFVLHYQTREFTLTERVLTQFSVLTDYLRLLFFPSLADLGLFHDDYPLSRSLLNPPRTLAAMGFILTLLVGAWRMRRRHPVFAFGFLWFFAGHAMESTVLSLEIYFEHRNYLPSAGLWFAVAVGVTELRTRLPTPLARGAFVAGVGLLIGLFALLTHAEARLWGDPVRQAEVWQYQKPLSKRAQSQLAEFHLLLGQHQQAARIYQTLMERVPNDAGAPIYWLKLRCNHPEVIGPDPAMVLQRLRSGVLNLPAMDDLVTLVERGECPELALETLRAMLEVIPANPTFVPRTQHYLLLQLKAILEERSGQPDKALALLDEALQARPVVALAIRKVAWLTQRQRFAEALETLRLARGYNRGNPLTWMIDQRRITGWEEVVTFLKNHADPVETP